MRSVLLAGLLCSGCTHMAEDEWTGRDKAEHFVASAVLAAAGSEYGQRQHHSDRQSQTVFINAGAGKEWYDSRPKGSGWSWKDFASDAAGAASGIALWNLSQ
ncbi:YfiM family lipoprotein [Pantoea agglomerans]|uniref:YfiM family lipoprotein n=1 Tax=Enterobacter agglomerans TaxID=549 RepID=UPI00177A8446|nr:YfiM family lipoprotein [Pantoea agglomerans]WVJ47265.1 YfiM family lipoprotein [Pantoea agglomerans]